MTTSTHRYASAGNNQYQWKRYGRTWSIDFSRTPSQFRSDSVVLASGLAIPRHIVDAKVYPAQELTVSGFGYIGNSDAELIIHNPRLDSLRVRMPRNRIADVYFFDGDIVESRVAKYKDQDLEIGVDVRDLSQLKKALDYHFHQYDGNFDFSKYLRAMFEHSNLPKRVRERFRSLAAI
jgi:hypothetical protein